MSFLHTRARRVLRSAARIGVAASGVALAALAMELPARLVPAHAAGVDAGDAQVVNPSTGVLLSAGTKDTDFSLRLPNAAACTGDSANDGYRVQSFHIVSSADPADLTFDPSGPMPNATGPQFRQPLYQINGNPYIDAQTAPANPAPGPGPIINIPAFDFALYDPSSLPPGTYNVGISCTKGGPSANQHDKFWNVQFTFANDLSWTVDQSATTTSSPASTAPPSTTATTVGGGPTASTTSTTVTTSTTASTTVATTSSTIAAGATTPTTRSLTAAGDSSVASGSLARAGSDKFGLAFAGFLLIVFGRMAFLSGRPTVKGTHYE